MDPSSFQLTSPAFNDNEKIPVKYTCKGENINPPLKINNAPAQTQSLAIIMHDPDAPGADFLHWTIWNISPETTIIEEDSTPQGALLGKTDFGHPHYGGPCPPSGTHRYVFDLYALNKRLDLAVGSSREDLLKAMQDHVVAQTTLTGLATAK